MDIKEIVKNYIEYYKVEEDIIVYHIFQKFDIKLKDILLKDLKDDEYRSIREAICKKYILNQSVKSYFHEHYNELYDNYIGMNVEVGKFDKITSMYYFNCGFIQTLKTFLLSYEDNSLLNIVEGNMLKLNVEILWKYRSIDQQFQTEYLKGVLFFNQLLLEYYLESK